MLPVATIYYSQPNPLFVKGQTPVFTKLLYVVSSEESEDDEPFFFGKKRLVRMNDPRRYSPSRRQILRLGVAVGGVTALSAALSITSGGAPRGDRSSRPARQHEWNPALPTDTDGTIRPPEHHILLGLNLITEPSTDTAATLETALSRLEEAYAYDSDGLLFAIGYGPSYFEHADIESPIPETLPLTELDSPSYDGMDAVIHLASNSASVVLEAEASLFDGASPNGLDPVSVTSIFERSPNRRSGFVGPGLPSAYDEKAGVPDMIPEESPFLMGFRSGFAGSQASEERVTIDSGPFSGGTTLHIESSTFNLRQWYEQDTHDQRVAKLFSPRHAEEGIGTIGESLGTDPGTHAEAENSLMDARTNGIVGHAQKAARGRDEDGSPVLLRRDINTFDAGQPGLHFVSYQRSLDDFVRVREAMTGTDLTGSGVGQRLNNGILQYLHVLSRGNYLVPPRDKRALPPYSP